MASKFSTIFRLTARALKDANAYERQHGPLSRSDFHERLQAWARQILGVINIDIEIRGTPQPGGGILMVGNHISYLDIPLLIASVPVVFVAKEEISKWWVFGPAAKKAGTLFVDRESRSSRAKITQAMADCLKAGQSLAIFPSGTTALDEDKPWRKGAFALAASHDIPVQPFRVTYSPLRKAAYIDRDFFPLHLWQLLSFKQRIKAVLEFGEVQKIRDPLQDLQTIRAWCQPSTTVEGTFKVATYRGDA